MKPHTICCIYPFLLKADVGKERCRVRVKRVFCQLAVKEIGYSGVEVARFLGLTTSAVNGSANSEELPEVNRDV